MSQPLRRLRSPRWDYALEQVLQANFGLTIEAYSSSLLDSLQLKLPAGAPLDAPESLEIIISTLAIHETYLMRHPEQFRLLEALVRERPHQRRPLRVWSAACSSGEECYSIAATLMGIPGGPAFEILGTDLDPEVIETARGGRYRRWSLRGLKPADHRHWLKVEDQEVQILPAARRQVRFKVFNLREPEYPVGFDIIFCRNALIYFSKPVIQEIFDRFHQSLLPGGLLITAGSDPPPREDSPWGVEYRDGVTYYSRGQDSGTRLVADEATLQTRDQGPARGAAPAPAADALQKLARSGRYDEALALARERIRATPADQELLVFAGMIALQAGALMPALQLARRAMLLEPEGVMANMLVGRAAYALGQTTFAIRRFCKTEALLVEAPAGPVKHGRGLNREQLLNTVRDYANPIDFSDLF